MLKYAELRRREAIQDLDSLTQKSTKIHMNCLVDEGEQNGVSGGDSGTR